MYAKVDLKEMEACLSSFELNNRNTIAENNSNPRYDNKHAYIIEEFKRVSKNKIQRERLVDRYYRSYIDEKGFAAECKTPSHSLTFALFLLRTLSFSHFQTLSP